MGSDPEKIAEIPAPDRLQDRLFDGLIIKLAA
jgi:hypothetical protein